MVLRLNACASYALCLDFLLERWQIRTYMYLRSCCGTRLLYFNWCRFPLGVKISTTFFPNRVSFYNVPWVVLACNRTATDGQTGSCAYKLATRTDHEEDYYKVINVINDVHIIFHAAEKLCSRWTFLERPRTCENINRTLRTLRL